MKEKMKQGKTTSVYPYILWGLAMLVYVVVFFHRVATGVVRQEVLADFGLLGEKGAGGSFALLGSMYFYAYMFMQIPSGILADTLGPRKTISAGILLASFASIGFAFSSNMGMAYSSRFLVGMGVSVVFVCTLKILADWFPKERFATLSGVTSFVGNMGAILAMTPLAILTSIIGWRKSFAVIGVGSLLLGVICYLLMKEKPSKVLEKKKVDGIMIKEIGRQLKQIIKNKKLYPAMLAYAMLFGVSMALTGSWGVTMLQDVYGTSKEVAANAMSVVTLGTAIGAFGIGKLSDKMHSRKKPMVLFATIHLCCWVLFAVFLPPVTYLFVLFFVMGVTSTSFVVSWAYAKEQHAPEYSGMAMSVMNFGGFLGGAIIPQIVGKLYDYLPKDNLIFLWRNALFFLMTCIAVALISLLLLKERKTT